MTNIEERIEQRLRRVGPRKNMMLESQAEEMKNNDKIIIMNKKAENGIENVDLILEPNKFDELSSKCRLTFDEYCDVINSLLDEEEKDWHELRMKDQVNLTRDAIIKATILKYAVEHYNIDLKRYSGTDTNYIKRYDENGNFIGEAIIITLTCIPIMGAVIK